MCGRHGDYLRHNVVPHCYRSHFPLEMKTHLSHDVVLLCQACQAACNSADQVCMASWTGLVHFVSVQIRF